MTGAPNITRTDSGRYLVGNVPASFVDADTAMAVYLDLAQRISHTERAHHDSTKKTKP
jgi:hypothetical protein